MQILITGATSGIGFELAKQLSERGHIVYITAHTKEQYKNLKYKIGELKLPILCFKMDINKKSDRKLIEKINIDCLINHAGIGNGGSILEMDINTLRENYETNIFSSFSLLQEFYKLKTKTKSKAKIFVTSSIDSMLPIPYLGCYTSSKAAISMLVFTIKQELKYLNNNISISLIEPGAYHTGFNQVMIDNKNLFTHKNSKIYTNKDSINRLQRNLFALIENKNYDKLIKKIIKEIESDNPKFKIRFPILQSIFTKIYLLLFR